MGGPIVEGVLVGEVVYGACLLEAEHILGVEGIDDSSMEAGFVLIPSSDIGGGNVQAWAGGYDWRCMSGQCPCGGTGR